MYIATIILCLEFCSNHYSLYSFVATVTVLSVTRCVLLYYAYILLLLNRLCSIVFLPLTGRDVRDGSRRTGHHLPD